MTCEGKGRVPKKTANYPHFVNKPLTLPPLSASAKLLIFTLRLRDRCSSPPPTGVSEAGHLLTGVGDTLLLHPKPPPAASHPPPLGVSVVGHFQNSLPSCRSPPVGASGGGNPCTGVDVLLLPELVQSWSCTSTVTSCAGKKYKVSDTALWEKPLIKWTFRMSRSTKTLHWIILLSFCLYFNPYYC